VNLRASTQAVAEARRGKIRPTKCSLSCGRGLRSVRTASGAKVAFAERIAAEPARAAYATILLEGAKLRKRGATVNILRFSRESVNTLLLLALLLASGAFSAASVQLPPTRIQSLTLDNGLRALLVERHEIPVVSIEVWYHVGSKNEQPGKTGFAHLFEHLMFDGTRNVGPEQFSSYIVRSGGEDNAYTTEDMTVFWETIPSTDLQQVLWLEADRMRNLSLTKETLQNEKEVVKEERRTRFDNQPYGSVVETLYRAAFTVHPYRHTAIGSMEDLDRASVDDVREFYNTYYVPNNATLVVTGDFDAPQVEEWIRKYFSPLERGSRPIDRDLPVEPQQTVKRVVKLDLDVALPAFVEGYHMPADGTRDAYPLRLAAKILSEGESSPIYRRLVYEKQIATDAESSGNFTEDPNLFFVFAVLNPGHAPAEGEREVETILEGLRNQSVSEDDLAKAKNQILSDFILGRETVRRRSDELGYDAVILKNPQLVNTEPARFLAVTPEDIQHAAKKYLVPENMTLVEVYPRRPGEHKSATVRQFEGGEQRRAATVRTAGFH
jgi:zinc protease